MYANYDFYTSAAGYGRAFADGERIATEADYRRLASRADAAMDIRTFGRLAAGFDGLPEAQKTRVKICECELCDLFYNTEQSAGVASENIDGYAVTYASSGNSGSLSGRSVSAIIKAYLWDTGYLYAGGGAV